LDSRTKSKGLNADMTAGGERADQSASHHLGRSALGRDFTRVVDTQIATPG
jgi:hypothetical protein